MIHVTEDSILQQPHSIGHCISADAQMSKGCADLLNEFLDFEIRADSQIYCQDKRSHSGTVLEIDISTN